MLYLQLTVRYSKLLAGGPPHLIPKVHSERTPVLHLTCTPIAYICNSCLPKDALVLGVSCRGDLCAD